MWLRKHYGLDYVDLITEPGMDRVLSQGKKSELKRLKGKVNISIDAHDSQLVAVVGHYDCAANPVSKFKHIHDIKQGINVVQSRGLPVRVVGLWVDDCWQVHVIS
ncbi:hypothetical protein L2716_17015 [Alkalihalobacillus berkeleyi]|uniref:Peptidase M28 domain-containing protein n=2 Tax=Pseudalkalibacillus berkeleyi TaxID=1069813 RepID=A0ABS9H6K5_9BACL|nr:hypothetical protein [Pseudalkalibacillus berkeleyi]